MCYHRANLSYQPLVLKFKSLVETKVKSLQIDWGGEFHSLFAFLSSHGIHHKASCPYAPPQNGILEHNYRHVVEVGLTMVTHVGMSFSYWSYAFHTTTYIINHLPITVFGHMSPYEPLYQRLPSYSSLRVFGCACFPLLRPYNDHKWQPRSVECVFLGYSSQHKGYLCLAPLIGHVYISRHVVFNEYVFPFKTTSVSNHVAPSTSLLPYLFLPHPTLLHSSTCSST